jgi:hypothetical protein
MDKNGKGTISENDLMQRLVNAKKVLNKVESGDFERGNVNEDILLSNPDDLISNGSFEKQQIKQPQQVNTQRIQESKLPDAIKKAMMENPIPQISLSDSLDINFVEKTKRLMESQGVNKKTNTKSSLSSNTNSNDLVKQITPIIENIVRKTVMEIMDTKLNQILTAQQTLSINENLVLKVGDSVFKGKITGVNKSK